MWPQRSELAPQANGYHGARRNERGREFADRRSPIRRRRQAPRKLPSQICKVILRACTDADRAASACGDRRRGFGPCIQPGDSETVKECEYMGPPPATTAGKGARAQNQRSGAGDSRSSLPARWRPRLRLCRIGASLISHKAHNPPVATVRLRRTIPNRTRYTQISPNRMLIASHPNAVQWYRCCFSRCQVHAQTMPSPCRYRDGASASPRTS
jgi:hypothetical protein